MKIFVTNFTGLCNRLEALVVAYSIRDYYGHDIFLDWPELDSFHIHSTKRGKLRWFNRLNCIKTRDCSAEEFCELGRYRNIIVRGITGGRAEALNRALPIVANDIRLAPHLVQSIEKLFKKIGDNPIVGVHLRRGDFKGHGEDIYDATKNRHPALPDWWIYWAMGEIRKKEPRVKFYLSYTGNPDSCTWLTNEYDCILLDAKNPYRKHFGHASYTDPVGDLFALACCPTILATPVSSFSHWAANILGIQSRVIMPTLVTSKRDPQMICPILGQQRLPAWNDLCRKGLGARNVFSLADLPEIAPVRTDWL